MNSPPTRDGKVPSRCLFLDIETFPYEGLAWQKHETELMEISSGGEIASIAWKWMGEKTTHVLALCDLPGYKKGVKDDFKLLEHIWKLLDEADVLIYQNGDAFDLRMIRSRLLVHKFTPPRPAQSIDTLKALRRIGRFPSNKLDEVCAQLGIGRKIRHDGLAMWIGCRDGDMKMWEKMKVYNKHDIFLLEELYYYLRPWIQNHPNLAKNPVIGDRPKCPICGTANPRFRGYKYLTVSVKRQWYCRGCGHCYLTTLPRSEYNDTVKGNIGRFA